MTKPNTKWVRMRRSELLANTSQAEKTALSHLHGLGYSPIRQYPIWTGRKMYFADMYIANINTIVEIDGGYHYTDKQKRLDKNRSGGLWRIGYHVVRLSNRDARDINKIANKIRSVVNHICLKK